MSESMGDSRDQAIAHSMLALDEQNDHLGLAVSGIFAQTVLDAAHRAGHIYWRDEYDAPYVAACEENERLRAAIRSVALTLHAWGKTGDHHNAHKAIDDVVYEALGDGEEGGRP